MHLEAVSLSAAQYIYGIEQMAMYMMPEQQLELFKKQTSPDTMYVQLDPQEITEVRKYFSNKFEESIH
ncbi:MAG TPA: hypothetical protein VJB08_05630 [Candidatus Nanoarchaeia archaeon]|nr:hypothetical protein [Candidatus Nanoarchaeia archaeon]